MQTLSNDLRNNLLQQAHIEYQSSLLYLHYAYWFDRYDLEGVGTFFKKESDEERKHSIQILDFLNARGYEVTLNPSLLAFKENEQLKFEKPFEIFKAYKTREDGNYTALNTLARASLNEVEPLTLHFINQMLEDQAASCDEVNKLYAKALAYSSLPGLFFHLDKEMETSSHNFNTWKKTAQ